MISGKIPLETERRRLHKENHPLSRIVLQDHSDNYEI